MVNPKYNFHVTKVKTDSFGRVICIQVTNDHLSNFQVTSIYAPTQPSARSSFFENITQYVSATLPLVLAGDFNMVEDPWLDKLGSRNTYATTGIKELNNIKNDFILIDVWRQNNPTKNNFHGALLIKPYNHVLTEYMYHMILYQTTLIQHLSIFLGLTTTLSLLLLQFQIHHNQVQVPGNLTLLYWMTKIMSIS